MEFKMKDQGTVSVMMDGEEIGMIVVPSHLTVDEAIEQFMQIMEEGFHEMSEM